MSTSTIKNVSVVDVRDGNLTHHRDVRIVDGTIASVRSTDATVSVEAAGDIDGAGKFLVPGFVDMHAHPLQGVEHDVDALALMLAHGITGFRQMAGSPATLEKRRSGSLNLGERSPRLLALSGSVLTPMNAGTTEAAVVEVARQAADGADFIKAGSITPEVYFAAQAEATRLGIPVVGHLPTGINVRDASRAGFHSIEHVGPGVSVIAGCSHDEEQVLAGIPTNSLFGAPPSKIPILDKLIMDKLRKMVLNPAMLTTPENLAIMRHAINTFDEDKARELARELAANDTWNCPTLIRVQAQQLCDNPTFTSDPDLRYLSKKLHHTWTKAASDFTSHFTAEQREIFAAQFDTQLRLVKIFDQEGVSLLAGTDTVGAVWVVAGSSLHREFDLLGRAGLSPLRVLQSATLAPAQFLHKEATSGTVDIGKNADLVILNANPIDAVDNLHSVMEVIRGGTRFSARDIEAIKDEVAVNGLR